MEKPKSISLTTYWNERCFDAQLHFFCRLHPFRHSVLLKMGLLKIFLRFRRLNMGLLLSTKWVNGSTWLTYGKWTRRRRMLCGRRRAFLFQMKNIKKMFQPCVGPPPQQILTNIPLWKSHMLFVKEWVIVTLMFTCWRELVQEIMTSRWYTRWEVWHIFLTLNIWVVVTLDWLAFREEKKLHLVGWQHQASPHYRFTQTAQNYLWTSLLCWPHRGRGRVRL